MLTHKPIGPYEDGSYLVVYPTPGCCSLTVACDCRTESQAADEVDRLNKLQRRQERDMRRERELCGLDGVYRGLNGAH